jgi:hypothetical protein
MALFRDIITCLFAGIVASSLFFKSTDIFWLKSANLFIKSLNNTVSSISSILQELKAKQSDLNHLVALSAFWLYKHPL